MALDNPQGVSFCNDDARPLADVMAQVYYKALITKAKWADQHLDSVLPPVEDLVEDGSATDGRPRMSGFQVNLFMGGVQGAIDWAEEMVVIPTNPPTEARRIDIIMGIAVNAIPR